MINASGVPCARPRIWGGTVHPRRCSFPMHLNVGFMPLRVHNSNSMTLVAVVSTIALIWCTIGFVLSRLSGWSTLARYRATNGHPVVERLRFQWARIGLVNFASCLRFDLTQQELRVRIWWPYRLFHPPIAIPWTDIHFERSVTGFWQRIAQLQVGRPERVRMQVSARTWQRFKPYVEAAHSAVETV